jgi:hypothetical protein
LVGKILQLGLMAGGCKDLVLETISWETNTVFNVNINPIFETFYTRMFFTTDGKFFSWGVTGGGGG